MCGGGRQVTRSDDMFRIGNRLRECGPGSFSLDVMPEESGNKPASVIWGTPAENFRRGVDMAVKCGVWPLVLVNGSNYLWS